MFYDPAVVSETGGMGNMSSDLTFLTNEPGNSLRDRLGILLSDGTRFFDCLVGYFFMSGFHKIQTELEKVEKIRVLVGHRTDRAGTKGSKGCV